jgi:UPF0271 protein
VAIGAHPSYPDREGFGRRELDLPVEGVLESVEAQIELLAECCAIEGARLSYVKAHGALYNRAARDPELARLLAECVARFDSSLTMLALAGSELEKESRLLGLGVAREAFIDRAYTSEGTLVPRDKPGAVIDDVEFAAARAVMMARDKRIVTIDHTLIEVDADSMCVHSDSRNALATVRAARTKLEQAGFSIASFKA